MTPVSPTTRRNRLVLAAIFVLFFGSLLGAGALRFAGWHPSATKNHGEMLQPYGDLRHVVPRLADGTPYPWNPGARIWRIAVAAPADCGDRCVRLAQQIDTVWQLLGQDADRVHVLWIGTPPPGVPLRDVGRGGPLRVLQPDAALRAGLPRVDGVPGEDPQGVPVYVIDPNGFVILRYAPGFDPSGLRADLSKLLKLM